MKKLYALLLCVVMVVGLSLAALGAPSPQAIATDSLAAIDVEVEDVEVSRATTNVVWEALGIAENADRLEAFGIPEGAVVASVIQITYADDIPEGGIQIPIKVNEASVGDYAYVLHRNAAGEWTLVGQGLLGEDLIVVATFQSLSPVMILVVPAEEVAAAGIRAPRTGEF